MQRLSKSLSADQIEAIKNAIHSTTTWSQLASVLEAIIGFKPKETFQATATGAGLCFRNQPRVQALKESVRCSVMMSAMSPLTYDALMCKLDNVKSSYELCEVLMQIVKLKFGSQETLSHLKKS